MITQEEFVSIKMLVETENQLIYRLKESFEKASEPQLKEDLQKFTAEITNCRSQLLHLLEEQNYE